MGKIILTGDRPTKLHLGHYVGSLRRRVQLQNEGDYDRMFVFMAGMFRLLTDNADNPEKIRQNIIEVALDYLAAGLDPNKCTLFIQSQIPELSELTTYLMNLVTVSRLQRNPTVKTEIKCVISRLTFLLASSAILSVRLLISQSSKSTTVPAGEDQEPMLEQTRELVRRFNTTYSEVLVGPNIMLPTNQASLRLPGTDGKAKMSKSLGNCIYLSDSAEDVWQKVRSMYTDPDHLRVDDPGKIDGNTVFTYLDAFSWMRILPSSGLNTRRWMELKDHYRRGGLGDMKCKFLNNVINKMLDPMRVRRHELEQDIPEIYNILKRGSESAREVAAQTMDEVRHAMRIDYFNDAELIREQSEKYKK